MKKYLFIIWMLGISYGSFAQFRTASLQATGLTCAMCSNAINKALQEVPFIESVKSDIKNSRFQIVFRNEADVNIDAISQAVEDAGFSVGSLQLTGQFNSVAVANDKHVSIGNTVYHFLDVKNQTLSGEQTITVLDKNFVTAKKFRKVTGSTKMACLQSGKAASCCEKEGVPAGARVYHVTI